MNYDLTKLIGNRQKKSGYIVLKSLLKLAEDERTNLGLALAAMLFSSFLNLLGPLLIGYTIDKFIQRRMYNEVLLSSAVLAGTYLLALFASYCQTRAMGEIGQRVLFNLRNTVFSKLQKLPVAFFNCNKAGDLISRVNNDTDKLNSFFSQSLLQFVSSIIMISGAGIFLLVINIKLGALALIPGLLILLFTKTVMPYVKKKNAASLECQASLTSEIQESLNNFKVIVAFNRRDYFRNRFNQINRKNFQTAFAADIANNVFLPIYNMFANVAQLIILTYGILLISRGSLTVGMLISYLAYTSYFYNPLRELATMWANFQVALAGWERLNDIISLGVDASDTELSVGALTSAILEFKQVCFGYTEEKEILHNVSVKFEKGKTYAFVGPTGGGKSTFAALATNLYPPAKGSVLLDGRTIQSYHAGQLTEKIGFIFQEPFLFEGTVKENILYGNKNHLLDNPAALDHAIRKFKLNGLLSIFENGLETRIGANGANLSIGQSQLISFLRAFLRQPEILILDEATANIDIATETLMDEILNMLPNGTIRIVIAHRLNTIQKADQIFFVNQGQISPAGSYHEAINKLLHTKRNS